MKLEHILFPIDFSENCQSLNPEVEWLANHFHANVTLLHVFEVPVTLYPAGEASVLNPECFLQFGDRQRERLLDYRIDLPEDRVSRILAEGDPAWNIGDWANRHDVDLMVMGTRGYGAFRRLLLGSVAMKVLHDVGCPVWTHAFNHLDPGRALSGIENLVCSVELNEEAVPLLRFAREMALDLGASVEIVHCVPEEEARPNKYFDSNLHAFLKEEAIKRISSLQRRAGTDFPVKITEGHIAQGAAETALARHADLIIVGRGKCQAAFGTLRTNLFPILSESPCPVLSYACDSADEILAEPARVQFDRVLV